jgi:hypothetical protein
MHRGGTKESGQATKRKFTAQEDQLVISMVREWGTNAWVTITKAIPNRTPRQCRERWKHYLAPGLSSAPWDVREDGVLREQYTTFGPKWAAMRDSLPGRSDVAIKNRWAFISKTARKATRPAPRGDPDPVRRVRPESPPATELKPQEPEKGAQRDLFAFRFTPVDESEYSEWSLR